MAKTGRNEPCPCGSGKKYKNCHESKTASSRTSRILMLVVGAAVIAAIAAGVSTFTGERVSVARFERAYITELLERTGGNISQAARISGKERSRLGKMLKKYGLERAAFADK